MKSIFFQKRLFCFLFIGFVALVIWGIVTHECGHYIAARLFGFQDAHISYASVSNGAFNPIYQREIDLEKKDGYVIANHLLYNKNDLDRLYEKEELWKKMITAAGPLETWFVGTIGCVLLIVRRKNYKQKEMIRFWQWIPVFMALFWLRPLKNLLAEYNLSSGRILAQHSDEFKIAHDISINYNLFSTLTCFIALLVVFSVVKWFVPHNARFTFIVAGVAGIVIGQWLWLVKLGPFFMP